MLKADQIKEYFTQYEFDEENRIYLDYHAYRYEYLMNLINDLVAECRKFNPGKKIKILDIGPSFLTELMRQNLKNVEVSTVGFETFPPEIAHIKESHFYFNLNDAQHKEKWITIPPQQIIVMAEVIEHLYTAPSLVLGCVCRWLDNNGFLIIQTPNAIALDKRIGLLLGRNIYEKIRENYTDPGHFHEYTKEELIELGKNAGLKVVYFDCRNYFKSKPRTIAGRIYILIRDILPLNFRAGITIVFQKE